MQNRRRSYELLRPGRSYRGGSRPGACRGPGRQRWGDASRVVRLSAVDLAHRTIVGDADLKLDSIQPMGPGTVVVGVSLQHDPLTRGVRGDVVGPRRRDESNPLSVDGCVDGDGAEGGQREARPKSGS